MTDLETSDPDLNAGYRINTIMLNYQLCHYLIKISSNIPTLVRHVFLN